MTGEWQTVRMQGYAYDMWFICPGEELHQTQGGFLKASQPLKIMLFDKRRKENETFSTILWKLKTIYTCQTILYISQIYKIINTGRQSFLRPKYKRTTAWKTILFILQSPSHLWFLQSFWSSQTILFPSFLLSSHSLFCSYRTKGQFPVQSACTGYPLKHHPTY